MAFQFDQKIYEGKAKVIYSIVDQPGLVGMEFKNHLTAFNGEKFAELDGKGEVNCAIATEVFQHLDGSGIPSHFIETLSPIRMVVKKVEVIPLEVVVRNRLAGSLAKKFGKDEGATLPHPLVEFFYKDDDLGDPFVSDQQIEALGLVKDPSVLPELKERALSVNEVLFDLFDKMNISLVDFKLEFGTDEDGLILLADEITPDSCRLWDKDTGEKFDKDRFRRDLGGVVENYQSVLNKMKQIRQS